jgi:membrane protein implicated in regulation of membrane protease activity
MDWHDWSPATGWWIAAGVLVAAELATGTFYLLMVSLGAATGALAAHLGAGVPAQIVVAALCGAGATIAWHLRRSRKPDAAPARENRDVNLDIGERVQVDGWAPDGTARVLYRGSTWLAHLAPDAPARPGPHRVSAVEGNWLVLSPIA